MNLNLLKNNVNQIKSDSNIKRNGSMDLIRGLAVVFMVAVHVLEKYANTKAVDSPFGTLVEMLGDAPAAPIFMFFMGLFFILASKSDSLEVGIRRGIKIFFMGVFLSFFRTDIFSFIDYFRGTGNLTEPLCFIWEVDILQFAGIAYILMAVIKKYLVKPIYWVYIAILLTLVGPFTYGIKSNILILDWFLNILWGKTELVFFPVITWIIYPLWGMIFAVFLKSGKSLKETLKELRLFSVAAVILGLILILTDSEFHLGDYYRSGIGGIVGITGFILIWIELLDKIYPYVNQKIISAMAYLGKNTTNVYVIQWILISWTGLIIKEKSQNLLITILMMSLCLVFTTILSKIWRKIKPKVLLLK